MYSVLISALTAINLQFYRKTFINVGNKRFT